MRFNDWQHDPLSNHSADESIAARDDMLPGSAAQAFGNIDAKFVGAADVAAMRMEAVSGPTHEQQPVFEWAPRFAAVPHYGQPESFPFGWQVFPSADMTGRQA